MQQLIDIYGYVFVLLVAIGLLAFLARWIPTWLWEVITVTCGVLLAVAGGYLSFRAIAEGGNANVGFTAIGGCAFGVAWAVARIMYFLDHRK